MFPPQEQSNKQTCILSHNSAQRHTFYLHSHAIHKHQTQKDICNILHDRHKHWYLGVLHPHIPSRKSIQAHHRGRSPYYYIIICQDIGQHIGGWSDKPHHQFPYRNLQHNKSKGYRSRYCQRARHQGCHLFQVATA